MTGRPEEVDRAALLAGASPVVVKVGTNVLADAAGRLDAGRVAALAGQLHRLRGAGRRVALVSSGAVGLGVGRLGLAERPTDLPQLQACAAVGQNALMQFWQDAFAWHHTRVGQILLTADDFDSRSRYLNARNTILTLLDWGVVPVINENDTVSVDEIRFGDNDALAAMVANLLQAPLLILLSVVDGLYTGDPSVDAGAALVPVVGHIDAGVARMAGPGQSRLGTGGMRTKLRAAGLATAGGCAVVLADGTRPDAVIDAASGASVGTLFLPAGEPVPAWKRWLGYTARPRGVLHLDAGAAAAVARDGRSLLPVGVARIDGPFEKGDVVSLVAPDGREVARGLCNYSSRDAEVVRGQPTAGIIARLGQVPYVEMVHRDNLAVFG